MKHTSVEASNSRTQMQAKSSQNRTVVQLLQQSLMQRGAAQLSTKPRNRTINSKQRRYCNTISQQSKILSLMFLIKIASPDDNAKVVDD